MRAGLGTVPAELALANLMNKRFAAENMTLIADYKGVTFQEISILGVGNHQTFIESTHPFPPQRFTMFLPSIM
jgi:hypothetical protein